MSYGTEEDRKAGRIAVGIALALVVAGGGWWYWQRPESTDAPAVATVGEEAGDVVAAADDTPPPIEHPLEAAVPDAPADAAPPANPDQAAKQALGEVFGGALDEWVVDEQLARRLVATVDNLPRSTSIEKLRPLRAPATPFEVQREVMDAVGGIERITLSSANYARYATLVALLSRTDAATAATAYRRIYPQLQAAYEDIGYPGRYFNDRLVAVIDHLLATPEPEGPLLLEQPKVMYTYSDADLEALSPGQKLLLRAGVDNARAVKQKLREFRAQIATQAPANNDNRE
jgi:hypothetical protein